MDGLKTGRTFLTERDEIAVRYEIAIALEGQAKLQDAIVEYERAGKSSASDSYYEMASEYNVARLNLALWLDKQNADGLPRLDFAIDHLNSWLEHDWNKLTTKMWGYYHGVCAYRQKIKYLASQGVELSESESSVLNSYTNEFLRLAREQKGVRLYELRFSAFFLASDSYKRFPEEPLKCGLNDLLSEFKIF